MDGTFDAPRRKPLLGADGQWDRCGLAAWLEDRAAFKAAMPDDTLAELGLRAGDLLITDDAVDFAEGGLVLVTEEEVCFQYVGRVQHDDDGRPCFDLDGELLPLQGRESPFGLALMIVGYLPMEGRQDPPTVADLLRARTLPPAITAASSDDGPIIDFDQNQLPF